MYDTNLLLLFTAVIANRRVCVKRIKMIISNWITQPTVQLEQLWLLVTTTTYVHIAAVNLYYTSLNMILYVPLLNNADVQPTTGTNWWSQSRLTRARISFFKNGKLFYLLYHKIIFVQVQVFLYLANFDFLKSFKIKKNYSQTFQKKLLQITRKKNILYESNWLSFVFKSHIERFSTKTVFSSICKFGQRWFKQII